MTVHDEVTVTVTIPDRHRTADGFYCDVRFLQFGGDGMYNHRRRLFVHNSSGKIMNTVNAMKLLLLAVIALALAGCVPPPEPLTKQNSELTQGNVQLTMVVGETTKTEVLETFGAPNITTRDGTGHEVWTYQRAAQVSQSSAKKGYWNLILAGQSAEASGFESSSRMTTLIIKFDEDDIVSDFRSRTSNF